MNLNQKDRPMRYSLITMKLIPALFLALTASAFAAPDPVYCKMAGSLARSIAEDRDRGVRYNAVLGQINAANEDVTDGAGVMRMAHAALKLVYLDMPKITPEGAYKLYYVACMSAK